MVQSLLRYLAIAHYGRGRGEYVDRAIPAFWQTEVAAAVGSRRERFAQVFARRGPDCDATQVAAALSALMRQTMAAVLQTLYPGSSIDERS